MTYEIHTLSARLPEHIDAATTMSSSSTTATLTSPSGPRRPPVSDLNRAIAVATELLVDRPRVGPLHQSSESPVVTVGDGTQAQAVGQRPIDAGNPLEPIQAARRLAHALNARVPAPHLTDVARAPARSSVLLSFGRVTAAKTRTESTDLARLAATVHFERVAARHRAHQVAAAPRSVGSHAERCPTGSVPDVWGRSVVGQPVAQGGRADEARCARLRLRDLPSRPLGGWRREAGARDCRAQAADVHDRRAEGNETSVGNGVDPAADIAEDAGGTAALRCAQRDGTPCKNQPMKGSAFCGPHADAGPVAACGGTIEDGTSCGAAAVRGSGYCLRHQPTGTCLGTTKAGTPCRAGAQRDSHYCPHHQPTA